MLFSSLEFLTIFFPVTFGVYFLLPASFRNAWLLLASLFFYAWGEPSYVVIMIGSIIFNYAMALLLSRQPAKQGMARVILALDVAVNLGVLFIFKYLGFAADTLRTLLPAAKGMIPEVSIALPIVISFFTFQAMSYVVDVYRGTPVQKNLASLGLYISLFPQLIAGPIVRYTTVMDEINERRISWNDFSHGCMRFLLGFNKKILLSNTFSEISEAAFAAEAPGAAFA